MKAEVLKACRYFLAPVVRLLIRSGVSWNEFAELAKLEFVSVARKDYGIQGRPTNSARVALMTGLSRREVARVKDILEGELEPDAEEYNRISRVLAGWHLDSDFQDETGAPLVLSEKGGQGSITGLFDRFAGDIPHGALLKELMQLHLVEKTPAGFRVLARDYIRSGADPAMLRQAGLALHDHATTIVHNINVDREGALRFERMASEINIDPSALASFEELLQERGQKFLEQMDGWLTLHRSDGDQGNRGKKMRAGVGVYLIFEEMIEDQNNEKA